MRSGAAQGRRSGCGGQACESGSNREDCRTRRQRCDFEARHLPLFTAAGLESRVLLAVQGVAMLPLRISIVTYNIWLTQRWDVRAPALRGFLGRFDPDIACFQELQQQSRDFIDGTLAGHKRVDDAHPGWTNESNIY